MQNFTFHNPTKVVFGKDTVREIGPRMKACGFQNILLLAGGGSIRKNGVYQTMAHSLKGAGMKTTELWGVRPNPLLSKVNEAIRRVKKSKAQAILAVGGGSVIDSAKAVAAGVYMKDIWAAFEEDISIKRALPLFTVLTVSGAASEFNEWAVVTNDSENKKWAIGGPALFPVVSIVDPSVQMSLPWKQTVYGAMDALDHIMENYFLAHDEEATLGINESLMNTIIKMVGLLQRNPNDYNARANLVWSAGLAHCGLTAVAMHGGDWGSHGIEHGISALHPEVAHGAGLAVLFPAWILYLKKENPATFKRWAQNVMHSTNIEDAVKKFRLMLKKWKAPTTLGDLGIKPAEIKAIAANANLQGPLGQLKKLSLRDIEAILKLSL